MASYKVFLTKSAEVAGIIARAYSADMQDNLNCIESIQYGCADGKEIVPAIYHERGYYYCAVELKNMDDQKYKLIIC